MPCCGTGRSNRPMLICGLLGAIFVAFMGATVGLNTPFYLSPENYSWKERLSEALGGAITGFLLGLIFGLPLNLILNRKSKPEKVVQTPIETGTGA